MKFAIRIWETQPHDDLANKYVQMSALKLLSHLYVADKSNLYSFHVSSNTLSELFVSVKKTAFIFSASQMLYLHYQVKNWKINTYSYKVWLLASGTDIQWLTVKRYTTM